MKNKRRWLALAVLLVGAAWAVASGEDEGAGAERPTIDIVVYDESDTDWSADLWQSQQMADAGGVIFNYQAIPGADFVIKRNAWIASGNLPDIWHDRVERPKDIADNIGPKGLLVPINEHLEDLPNLARFMNKYPEYENVMQSPDGNQYGVAYIYDFVPFGSAPAIRGYILEERGIDPREDIQTMDDLYNALSVIKQYDLETKDEENFPWTARSPGRFVDRIGMMWGVGQNMYYDDGAGAFQYGPLSPRFRVMVDFVRRAYEDGLIHPDVWSMPDEVMEGLSRQERVHFWVDNIWNGYFWGDREGKDQLEMTDHPFVAILPPMVDGQRYYASRAGNNVDTGQLWLVSAKTEYLDNILRMINWGLSDEGIYAMAMGKENYSYVRNDQGMRIWPAPGLFTGTRAYNPETGEAKDFAAEMEIADPANFSAPEPWVILSKEFKNIWRAFRNFNNFVWPESTSVPTFYEAAPVRFADGEWLASAGVIADPAPQLTFTNEELDRRKVLETAINTLSDEMVVKFTTGQEPMSNWDAFASQLRDFGVEELVQIYNTALGRQG